MGYSPATMMVGAEAEEMTPLEEYDGDKDGWIQLEEARVAVGDYFERSRATSPSKGRRPRWIVRRPLEPKGTVLSLEDG
jgi:hypothetical protein